MAGRPREFDREEALVKARDFSGFTAMKAHQCQI